MGKMESIAQWLREELSSGRLEAGARIPSEYELAERFGVNKTTANKAVAQLVADGLLERGRRGSGTYARSRGAFSGRIIFIANATHPYYAMMVHGAQRRAMERGYMTVLAAPRPEDLNEFVSRLTPGTVDGILTSTYGKLITPPGLPVVHLDREFAEDVRPRHLVNADGFGGMRMLTEEFLRNGHRQLALLSAHHLSRRNEGFVAAMEAAGIPDAAGRVFVVPESSRFPIHLFNEIRSRHPGLTGILSSSDDLAYNLALCLDRESLSIPGDISLGGFGNVFHICELLDLTSVEQHPFDIGSFAAGRLLDMVEEKRDDSPFVEELPCELIRRHSIKNINH